MTTESDPILCRDALRQLFERYLQVVDAVGPVDPKGADQRLAIENLKWMCRTALEGMDMLPLDKTNRWLGFIQGCLAMRGLIDVDVERDVSRPLFHAAYGGSDKAPKSLARNEQTEAS